MVDADHVKAAMDFEVATCVGTAVRDDGSWRQLGRHSQAANDGKL
jgi:hypothetical protein